MPPMHSLQELRTLPNELLIVVILENNDERFGRNKQSGYEQ